jgi:acyl carrier protein phosphodiesterase
VPLRGFTERFHEDALQRLTSLPETASTVLRWMIAHDRLYSYRETGGVEITLHSLSRRLNRRLNRDIRLQDALPGLMAARADLEADFVAFFPDLVETARGFWAGAGSANLQHLRHDHIGIGKLDLLDRRAVERGGVQ